jgi:DNA-binding response OmpR family regulator
MAWAPRKFLAPDQFLTSLWGPKDKHDLQDLRVFVCQFRQTLERVSSEPRLILTEAGVRHRFQSA